MAQTETGKRILVVDDDEDSISALCRGLNDDGYEVTCVHSGEEAIGAVFDRLPDLLIIDLVMPDLSGYEVVHKLGIHPETGGLKKIMLCRNDALHREFASRFEMPLEYAGKPVDVEALKRQVRHVFERQKSEAAVEPEGEIDPLTGVFSGSYVVERIKTELERSVRHQYPFSAIKLGLLYEDGDQFQEGNAVHEMLVKESTGIIKSSLRSIDVMARVRGFEFLILMPRFGKSTALINAQKLRNDFESFGFSSEIDSAQVKVNMGLKSAESSENLSSAAFMSLVDEAFEKARKMGQSEIIAG